MSAANHPSTSIENIEPTPEPDQYHIPDEITLVYKGQEVDNISDIDLESGSYRAMAVEAEDAEAEEIKEILNGENVLGAVGENIERLDYVIDQLTEPEEDVIQVTTRHPNYEILIEEYEDNQLVDRKKAENYIEGRKAIQASIYRTNTETLELTERAGLLLEEVQETKQDLKTKYENQEIPERESNKIREKLEESKETIEKLKTKTDSRTTRELRDEIRAMHAGLEMTEAEINKFLNDETEQNTNLGDIL